MFNWFIIYLTLANPSKSVWWYSTTAKASTGVDYRRNQPRCAWSITKQLRCNRQEKGESSWRKSAVDSLSRARWRGYFRARRNKFTLLYAVPAHVQWIDSLKWRWERRSIRLQQRSVELRVRRRESIRENFRLRVKTAYITANEARIHGGKPRCVLEEDWTRTRRHRIHRDQRSTRSRGVHVCRWHDRVEWWTLPNSCTR